MNKFLFFTILFLVINACDSAQTEPIEGCESFVATYDTNVKEIIDLTCAYTGCHNGSGEGPGDYRTFEGLTMIIRNGTFVSRVIDQADNPSLGMPPDFIVYPTSQQDDLSPEQLEIILCWIDAGFPEA